MNFEGKHYRTIWLKEDEKNVVQIIDQRWLPHQFIIEDIKTSDEAYIAIKDMHVRGAGLIGCMAAYGVYLAALESAQEDNFEKAFQGKTEKIKSARPTAVNLVWAVNRMSKVVNKENSVEPKIEAALLEAGKIADEDADISKRIGEHGLEIIQQISEKKKGKQVHILTHCNAGWLAFVDHGTATAPIYIAKEKGIDVHVWVDETRPRNQGASLTAWEMLHNKVPHTVIADNTGGHLMQNGMVDMVIVGTDRTTVNGDVANKIGTYLKALAAFDNQVPFYVALPSSSIDWELEDGFKIPIEQRNQDEVKYIYGLNNQNNVDKVLLTPTDSQAANYAFDITPARLLTGLITERGICKPNKESIFSLFPEKK